MSSHRPNTWFTLIGLLFMSGVFVFEVTVHLFLTVVYIALAGITFLYAEKVWQTLLVAISAAVFLIVGYIYVIGWVSELDQFTILVNRMLALVLIFMAIYFTHQYRKYQTRQMQQRLELRERTAAEERLKSSEALYKSIARNFPEGWIGILDEDFNYIFAEGNGLCMDGVSSGLMTSKKFTQLIRFNREEAEQGLLQALNGKEAIFDIVCNGRTFEVNAVPFNHGHSKQRILVVVHDIDARKKSELELMRALEKERQLGEMKTRFVTLASHEFRTPLTTILSSAFLLESYTGEKYEENKLTHINRIKRSVKVLTEILNDFLSLGKLEEGEVKPHLSEFSLKEFLNDLEKEVEPLKRGQQQFVFQHAGADRIVTDKQVLRNILYNLISNACKYTHTSDTLQLESSLLDNHLEVSVTDHGIGIPEEEQQYIFKRFYRAQNAMNIQGTGLGLNIVRRYVQLLGGNILFTSKPYDKTAFTVTIPVTIKEEVNQEALVL